MKVIDTIKESVLKYSIEWMLALLSPLLVTASLVLRAVISERVLPGLSKEWLAGIAASSIFLLLLETAYIFHHRTLLRKSGATVLELSKLFHAYGALWSKDLTPHCPACRVPLGGYGTDHGDGPGCECLKCGKVIRFREDDSRTMNLAAAKAKLSNRSESLPLTSE